MLWLQQFPCPWSSVALLWSQQQPGRIVAHIDDRGEYRSPRFAVPTIQSSTVEGGFIPSDRGLRLMQSRSVRADPPCHPERSEGGVGVRGAEALIPIFPDDLVRP